MVAELHTQSSARAVMKLPWLLLLILLSPMLCYAPAQAALREAWPDSLASHPGFNAASRAEILSFGAELMTSELLPLEDLARQIGGDNADGLRLEQYRQLLWRRLLTAYRAASQECPRCAHPATVAEMRQLLLSPPVLPERYLVWQKLSREYHARYLQHLLRRALAVDIGGANESVMLTPDELTGFELMDGEFLLTFDGGPSVLSDNRRLVQMLNQSGQNAVFFLVGTLLQDRLHAGSLQNDAYADNCVATQGMLPQPLLVQADWSVSLAQGRWVLQSLTETTRLPWFRPPDGLRDLEISTRAPGRVILWNIESHDAAADASAERVTDEVMTQMLLWRRGVIRFHETQPWAATILPALFARLQTSPVRWVDCRTYADH